MNTLCSLNTFSSLLSTFSVLEHLRNPTVFEFPGDLSQKVDHRSQKDRYVKFLLDNLKKILL